VFKVLRRLKSLIYKESLQIIRDPSSILIAFILPLILLILYGYGVSLDLTNVKVGVVMEDSSPDARNLLGSFTNSRYFDVKVAYDRESFKDDLVAGYIKGIIVIPQDFSKKRLDHSKTLSIQVITDGSEPNTASFVKNYANGVLLNWLNQEKIESSNSNTTSMVTVIPRVWFNPELRSRNFLVPGTLAIIMALTGTLLTSLVVAREWERGTMEALMSTPITIIEILIGKLFPYFVLSIISLLMSFIIALILYDLPFRGSLTLLLITSSAFLFASLGHGLIISTLSRNQFVAAQASLVTAFLPSFLLSGFIFEISSMPGPIQLLTVIIPAKYFVSNLQTLFLAGNIYNLILINTAYMLIIGLILFVITAKKTVKRLD
jgi:ABC-2 type transport system permease protein